MEFRREGGEWFLFAPFKLISFGDKSSKPMCLARLHRDKIWNTYVVTVTVEEGPLSSEIVYKKDYQTWGSMLSDTRTLDTRGIRLDVAQSIKL